MMGPATNLFPPNRLHTTLLRRPSDYVSIPKQPHLPLMTLRIRTASPRSKKKKKVPGKENNDGEEKNCLSTQRTISSMIAYTPLYPTDTVLYYLIFTNPPLTLMHSAMRFQYCLVSQILPSQQNCPVYEHERKYHHHHHHTYIALCFQRKIKDIKQNKTKKKKNRKEKKRKNKKKKKKKKTKRP